MTVCFNRINLIYLISQFYLLRCGAENWNSGKREGKEINLTH